VANWAARALNFRQGELPLAALSALFYFCVLCGYYFLRPVRDAMGVARGMDDLRWLFIGTSVVALIVVLAFGGVVSRLDRRRFIPIGFGFVIACLLLFAGLLVMDAWAGGGLIGTDSGTTFALVVGYAFFMWLTVINLFVNSLFWAFMVDLFNVDQGKRMFAFIGVGGTVGALFGGWITNLISGLTESVYLSPALMLIGAVFFAGAIWSMLTLDRMALGSEHSRLSESIASHRHSSAPNGKIGGSFTDGVTAVARSPYLIGIALYIVFLAIANTFLYFTQASIVLDNADTLSQRIGSFALLDALTQVATLLTQIFVTTRLIRGLGVGWTLSILPLVTMAGYALLAIWPAFGVFALFNAVHRATRYAISRPARETLFSVVPPGDKYKAKPFIDVFLYRGGDVAGAAIDGAMRAVGLSLVGVAAATVPLVAVWGVLSFALGRAQQRLDREQAPDSRDAKVSEPGLQVRPGHEVVEAK
jgi:AAA family ATP:ADP antiporter